MLHFLAQLKIEFEFRIFKNRIFVFILYFFLHITSFGIRLTVSKVILGYEMPEICILKQPNCIWNLMLPRLEQTDEHWSYLYYKLVKEFSARSFLPPPFNIFHRCWQIISMIKQSNRCCSTINPSKEFELSMVLIVTC